jgi:hypothetical protein
VQRMHRPNVIEGTLSELARGHGLRRSRYRSFAKVELQDLLIGTACNIKRWLRCLITSAKHAQNRVAGLNSIFPNPRRRSLGVLALSFWPNVLSRQALSLLSVSA